MADVEFANALHRCDWLDIVIIQRVASVELHSRVLYESTGLGNAC